MRSSRIALFALLVVALALPIAGLAYDRPEPALDRTDAYKAASHVVEGQVKSLQRLDRAGKPDSSGPRFTLAVAVSKVHKTTKKKPIAKGNTVSVLGWVEGEKKQTYLPRVKEEVITFLKPEKAGAYEVLEKTGFKARSSTRGAAAGVASPASPPDRKK
jgi:hypothetical protein